MKCKGLSKVVRYLCCVQAWLQISWSRFPLGLSHTVWMPFSVPKVHPFPEGLWSHGPTELLIISGMEVQGLPGRWHLRKLSKMARGSSCSSRDRVELTKTPPRSGDTALPVGPAKGFMETHSN